MTLRFRTLSNVAGLLALSLAVSACGESRAERLARELSYENAGRKQERSADDIAKVPPHPLRTKLEPLLTKLYSGNRLPDVLEAEIAVADPTRPYELSAGVLSVIRLKLGLSDAEKAKAIITATAEADAWVHRAKARKPYADHIHKVMRSFGDDQKVAVLQAYGSLKLLNFFNGEEGATAIAALPADVQGAAKALQSKYVGSKEAVWAEWMAVKMYARREVSRDEPFKPVLRAIRKDLGHKEPEPITWEAAHDAVFKPWATQINGDKELFAMMSNLKELADQEEFRNDTHTLWVVEGSSMVPSKAKGVKIDSALGFGVHREDLGGGFQELTLVFSKRLKGAKLKRAYLQSQIYRHLFTDFMMLSTAGGDFKEKQVPDKYDPSYAKCGSQAAIDTFINNYRSKYPLAQGLRASLDNSEKIMARSVTCIVAECSPEIRNPDKNDVTDVEGPAPGSRLAFFQMLARFENIEVDMNAMRKEEEKSQDVLDAEAFLKANKNEHL